MRWITGWQRCWLCFFILAMPGLALATSKLFFPRADAVPGGVALVTLEGASRETPTARFEGQPVMVVRDGQAWRAVVGIPLTTSPGPQSVQVRYGEQAQRTIAFTVQDKQYAEQRITLQNQRMVEPNPEDLKRIGQDTERIQKALAHWSPIEALREPFIIPVQGEFSSPFGLRRFFNDQPRKPHSGLDIAAPSGTPIRAPLGGQVIEVGDYFFNGKTVFLDHGQGLVTMYCHMTRIDVKTGQRVAQGTPIGTVGKTGRVTGAHLHWSVSLNRTMVDPLLFLPASLAASQAKH